MKRGFGVLNKFFKVFGCFCIFVLSHGFLDCFLLVFYMCVLDVLRFFTDLVGTEGVLTHSQM